MTTSFEKSVEILSGEEGVSIVLRPLFPFVAEGYRLGASGLIEIFGEGKRISLAVPPEALPDVRAAEQINLCEFTMDGHEPIRELILHLGD